MDWGREAEQKPAEGRPDTSYGAVYDALPDGIVVIDPLTTGVIAFNDTACRQLGYTREEFAELTVADWEAAATPAQVRAHLDQIIASGRDDYRTRHRTKAGELREMAVTAQYITMYDRMVIHAICRDVTDVLLTRRALRASAQRYRVTFESAPVGIADVGLNGRFLRVNPAFCQMLGYEAAELARMTYAEVTAPEDLTASEQAAELLLVGERDALRFAKRYMRRDGTPLWVELTVALVRGVNEQPLYFVSVAQDITERRRTEESVQRLVAAVDSAAEAVIVTDARGEIRYVNSAFEQMTGYARDEAVGQSVDVLRSGQHDAEFIRDMWATIAAGHTWRGCFVNRRRDGSLYTTRATIAPVRDPSGRITEYVSCQQDITSELTLADRLSRSQLHEALGQLAAGIAHDFKNILQAVLGFATLLDGGQASPELQAEALAEVRKVAERGTGLVGQLLHFSRREGAEPVALDLNSLLRDLTKMLGSVLGRPIRLELNLAPDLRAVRAGVTQLEQIVVNLATNARDAMADGGTLRFSTANLPGPWVKLEVSDTGAGIPPDIVARIFEPYFTTKDGSHGSGLGLATVASLVDQLGGRIEVASEVGRGTSFTLLLPTAADTLSP